MEFKVLCNTGVKESSSTSLSRAIKILIRMKLVILFLTIVCSQAWSNGYSQPISLNLKNVTLEKVFSEIRKQSPYRFIYAREDIINQNLVSLHIKNVRIEQVMEICLQGQSLTYIMDGKHIIIKKKHPITEVESIKARAALIDVSGRIVNEDKFPMGGVSVQVKGDKNKGTSTDANGLFMLKQVDEQATLLITSTNIETREININGLSNLGDIAVVIKFSKLDEVQIIAYGTNTQRYNVGSVTKITAEEIGKQPISNPLAALQGRVPGLVVTSTSGLPGASFNIQIRGQNALNPDPYNIQPVDNPLIIIDGVPFAPQNNNLNQFNSVASPGISLLFNNPYGGISPLNNINPSDIESIEVLRDADATAIYGSRGANGVILITTKKASEGEGKTNVNLNVYTAISTMPSTMEMMNTEEYLNMRREAFNHDGLTPGNNQSSSVSFAPDLTVFDSTKYTDWKEMFIGGTANVFDANLSITGGSKNTQFMVGGGFRRETNIYKDNFKNERGSAIFNLHHKSLNSKLSINLSANYSFSKNQYASGGAGFPNLLLVYSMPPNYPDLLDAEGNLVWEYNGLSLGGLGITTNPHSYYFKKHQIQTSNLISNLKIEYSILQNLRFRTNLGYSFLYSNEFSGNPSISNDPDRSIETSANFGNRMLNNWIIEPQIEFNKNLKKIKFNFLAGSTIQHDAGTSQIIRASGYANDALIESVSGASDKIITDDFNEYRYNGVFARMSIIGDSKYILNLSARRDGSSRFGPGKQFGNFGSVGAGWLFAKEKIISDLIPAMSYGKFRISYGSTGNDNIGNYQYISRWSTIPNTFQGSTGYAIQNHFNPDFSWAITRKFEIGFELGLFKDKILLNTSWYRNRSGNQLVFYPLPSQTGFINVVENLPALVENKGWEIQLSTQNLKSKNFSWNTSMNITIPTNKLIAFPGLDISSYAGTYIIGESLSVLNKYEYAGVNPTTGLFEFISAKGDTTNSPTDNLGSIMNDKKVIGNLDPTFYGGINNNFQFRNFGLSIFFEFKKQIGENFLAQIYGGNIPGTQNNLPAVLNERWRKPGDISNFQKVSAVSYSAAAQTATVFRESSGVYSDASYIKCRTISLSYEVLLERIKISKIRFYFNVQNLFTITGYQGNDPETKSFFGIPPLKTFATGLSINL